MKKGDFIVLVLFIGAIIYVMVKMANATKEDKTTSELLEEDEKPGDGELLLQYQNKYANILGILAIIELVASIILAMYIWANSGVGLGFGILIQGIVVFVILSTLKTMAEDIADIKNLLNKNDR